MLIIKHTTIRATTIHAMMNNTFQIKGSLGVYNSLSKSLPMTNSLDQKVHPVFESLDLYLLY